jgi:hypothetical protein
MGDVVTPGWSVDYVVQDVAGRSDGSNATIHEKLVAGNEAAVA